MEEFGEKRGEAALTPCTTSQNLSGREDQESWFGMCVPVTHHRSRFPFGLFQVSLNDSHNQMVVHWAGEKSNVIVALARDSLALARPKSSDVSISGCWALPGAMGMTLLSLRVVR